MPSCGVVMLRWPGLTSSLAWFGVWGVANKLFVESVLERSCLARTSLILRLSLSIVALLVLVQAWILGRNMSMNLCRFWPFMRKLVLVL